MSARLTLATARRVLLQVRGDHRTLAMLIAVPCVLIGLLAWIFNGTPVFDKIGAPLLGVFPFVVMRNITTNGKTPSNGAPILSNTGVPLKIQASKPISTHGTAINMARVRWSPRT